jgi:hypothetical protein
MSESRQSDAMKKLVLFMTGLAIAGAIIAFAWYFAAVFPVQHAALIPPLNIRN